MSRCGSTNNLNKRYLTSFPFLSLSVCPSVLVFSSVSFCLLSLLSSLFPPCVPRFLSLFFCLPLSRVSFSPCWTPTCSGSSDLPPHLERIKQQANDAFARQQWTQAIQLYSLGIHEASRNAMLYGNRAAAYMKRKW